MQNAKDKLVVVEKFDDTAFSNSEVQNSLKTVNLAY